MYNFSSAISTNSFSSSPLLLAQNQSKNLEPTTFSLNDGSPIAFKRYPSDAMTASTSIPNLMQRSYSHSKLQRRNTTEVSRNSPIMTYKGSRSPSPVNLSRSPNSISIRSGSIMITAAPETVHNVQIYEALKEQKKKFFQRGQSLQLTTIFPQKIETQTAETAEQESPKISSPARVKPSTLANLPLNTEASETMLPEGKSFAGLSPRRRLAESALKTYNVKPARIKDQMKDSLKSWNVLMRSKGKKGVFEIKTRSNSNIVKPVETKSAYMRELEKTLNEERKALDKLGEIGSQKFGAKLNLYNKYYDEYLDEPEHKYMGQADLKVEVKPIIEESALSIEARKFQAKKKMPGKALQSASTKIFAVKELIGVKDLNFTQASAQSSPPKRENSVRFRVTTSSPSRRVKVEQEEDPEEKPAAEENGEWKYFGKEMSKVQDNIMGLQKINAYMGTGKTELTDQETKFFRMVKAGNTLDVQNMLKINGELVKIRDSTNQTPLHWAVKRGLAEVLGVLLEAGADLEAVDMTGRKVLDVLPTSNRKEILDMIDQKEWEMKRKAAQ